jgi:hypothetical protein
MKLFLAVLTIAVFAVCLGCRKGEEAGRAGETEKEAELASLKTNMYRLQTALEVFSASCDKYYPSGFETRGYANLPVSDEPFDSSRVVVFKNSIAGMPWVRISEKDPPQWSSDLRNQVVWIPTGKFVPERKAYLPDSVAKGYKIFGGGPDGFIDLVLMPGEQK